MRTLRVLITILLLSQQAFAGGARLFDDASSEGLTVSSALATSDPMSMGIWIYYDDELELVFMEIADGVAANHYYSLSIRAQDVNNFVTLDRRDGGVDNRSQTTLAPTINTWNYATAVMASATSGKVFVNGGNSAENTTSTSPLGLDTSTIGQRARPGGGKFMSGRLAHGCVWDAALSDAQVLELSNGSWPMYVQTGNIVGCAPIFGNDSPEVDLTGLQTWTLNNTPVSADGPPVYMYAGGN